MDRRCDGTNCTAEDENNGVQFGTSQDGGGVLRVTMRVMITLTSALVESNTIQTSCDDEGAEKGDHVDSDHGGDDCVDGVLVEERDVGAVRADEQLVGSDQAASGC